MAIKNILVFQHVACEHPGVFRDFLRDDGIAWTAVELDDGEPIPAWDGYDALLVMGGPMDVWEEDKHPWLAAEKQAIRRWVEGERKPFLGVCLGHQLLAAACGGTVGPAKTAEVGMMAVTLSAAGRMHPLFDGFPERIPCLQWHSAEVLAAPPGATVLASSPACGVNAFAVGDRAFGIQYHMEITPSTVEDWAAIPAYRTALEAAMGPGAAAKLKLEADRQMTDLTGMARRFYRNFMRLAASAA